MRCKCGSYAVNHQSHGRDGSDSDLCDVCYWRKRSYAGWKEAAIAWSVCASIHEKWAKGKDALYSTRHADFEKHADDARLIVTPNVK